MSKKILRWTIGDTNQQGIDILKESIRQAKKVLKQFNFDFYVCANGTTEQVEKICLENQIKLVTPNWTNEFPLPNVVSKNYDINSELGVPNGRQGSFWKICPPRLHINSYEIVLDNDVIIKKCPKEFCEFLNKQKVMLWEDNLMTFGKYTKFIKNPKPYNSGLYGLPPKFDFKNLLIKKWQETKKMQPLMSRDEQGLIIATLLDFDFIEIPKEKTCFVFNEGQGKKSYYEQLMENGFQTQKIIKIDFEKSKLEREILHFLGANREENHHYWNLYCRFKKNKLL